MKSAYFLPKNSYSWIRFRFEGPDTLDFLQRLTTVNARDLILDKSTQGFFLTPQGKIRAAFWITLLSTAPRVYSLELEAGTSHEFEKALKETIEFYTFSEKIHLSLETESECIWIFDQAIDLWSKNRQSLWLPASDIQNWCHEHSSWPLLDEASIEHNRILSLSPRLGHEIDFNANPLDLGLRAVLADQKGCYPGQEVIEKMISIGSPSKRLVLLNGQGSAPIAPTALFADETLTASIGTLTSSTPQGEGYAALAVIRKSQAIVNQNLFLTKNHSAKIIQIAPA